MKAFGNLIHGIILALWAVLGLAFTLKAVFGQGPLLAGALMAGSYWLWLAGLAGLTTVLVKRFQGAVAALLVHASIFVVLSALPRVFPLNLLRLGLDLLAR